MQPSDSHTDFKVRLENRSTRDRSAVRMASVTSKNTTKARKRSTLLTINVPVSSETNEYISSYSSACAYKGTLVVVVGSS